MNIWALRPKIDEDTTAEDFVDNELIAIGWDRLPDLKGKTKDEITDIFHKKYDESGQKASLNIGIIDRFVNEFGIGDIVFVPDDELVHVAEITEDYMYDLTENISPHIRKVKWIKKNVLKSNLPDKLQQGLKSRMSLYSLDKYRDFVAYWINQNAESLEDKFINYSEEFKIFIGLEAIKYVGTYSQAHYDVVQLSLNKFIDKEYKKMVENIIDQSKGILLEVNDTDKFEIFFDAVRRNEMPKLLFETKNDIANEYKERLLEIINVEGNRELTESEYNDKSFEIYKINKELNEEYSNLKIKELIYSKVKKEIENNISESEKEKLNKELDPFNNLNTKQLKALEEAGIDTEKFHEFKSKLSRIIDVLFAFNF
ncbi:MAG: hypothetical protein ACOCZ5_03585 [bacterium]